MHSGTWKAASITEKSLWGYKEKRAEPMLVIPSVANRVDIGTPIIVAYLEADEIA